MALPRDPGGRPRPARRPSLQRHPSFPVPKPEIQRSAPPPRRAPRPTGVFRTPTLTAPTRNLTRPTPTKRIERKLPPAVAPSYPVLRHYTPAQQRTIVRGIQRAGGRSPDRGAIRPSTLAPLGAVRRQQEAAANRRYARGFGVTPQQAAVLRTVSNLRSHAQAKIPHPPSLGTRLLHALLTGDTGQPSQQTAVSGLTRNLATAGLQPATGTFNPLGATYEKAPHIPLSGPLGLGTLQQSLGYDAARNKTTADVFGRELQRSLRSSAKQQRSGSGGSAIAPAFLRAPLSQFLTAAGDAAPVLTRVGAGAGNDLGQYILGAVPSAAMLWQQTAKDPVGAMQTLAGSTADILKHPLDHPLFALQIAHGGVNAVSRGAGALGRSGIAGARVKGALNTRRAPLQIGGPAAERLLEYRHYSKSPLVMGLQKLADRRLAEGTAVVDQHGRAVRAKLAPQSELGGIRRSISALHTSTLGQDARGRLRGYGDFAADRANSVERHNRAAIQRELVKMMPTRAHRGGRAGQAVGAYLDRVLHAQPHGPFSLPRRMYRPERDVIGLVIRGRVRNAGTFRADLEAELGRLKARAKKSFAHPEERALNEQNQRSIERVLADPRAMRAENVKRLVDAGRALAGRGRELTKQAVRQGALTPEAAARAPLFDYAIAHMGARYVTAEEHAQLERAGLKHERAAAQAVQDVHKQIRKLEADLRRSEPHNISAPQGGNFLNRQAVRDQIDDLTHEHAQMLERYNAMIRRQDSLREQMNAIPAGPERERFRAQVYRPASDEFQKFDTEVRRMHNRIEGLQQRVRAATRGELVTGQPERPVRDITWYQGTEQAYSDMPTAIGKDNDLGVYMTSDPHYATAYSDKSRSGMAPAPGVQVVHVNPRKVLETRFGRVNPDEIATVIERLLHRADQVQKDLEDRTRADLEWRRNEALRIGNKPHPPGFEAHQIGLARDNALFPHTRETLERWQRLLRTDKATRDAVSGKTPLRESIDNGTLAGWQELDRTIMRGAAHDLTRAEGLYRGPEPGRLHSQTAWGRQHQPTRLILRELGYDAVRKVDQHADSLVVLNESVLRRPGEPRPRTGGKRADVQIGSHLEAQDFERSAAQHDVHVVATTRKGDGIVAHVQGDREAIDRLAAQHAHRTGSNVLAFHHAGNARGAAYTVRDKDGTTTVYLNSNPDDAYAAALRERHPNAEIIETPGTGRMLTPESHAAFARDIRTAGNQTRDQLARDLESARGRLEPARAAHAQARATRIAVSGRHPELVDKHEAAVARAAGAKRKMKQAQAAHAREVAKRQRTIGTQQSRRGRRQAEELGTSLKVTRGERPTGRATAAEQARLAAHDTAIRDAAAARRAAEKAHRDARAAVPARPPISPALRDAEGKLLTNEQIHAHMRANGVPFDREGPLISYVPDRPDVNSRASYHRAQALLKRDTVESGFQRTGAAQQKGITGQSFNLVADHMVRMGITTGDGAIGQFDKLAREVGTVDKDGRPFDSRSAAEALANLNAHPDQPKLVAVRLFPGRYSPGQRDLIQRIQGAQALDPSHYGSDLETYVERSFADRVLGDDALSSGDRTRNIALMPEELVSRFQQHLSALSTRSPTGALLAKGFRTAVLPFSVKWLTGNVAEAIIRLAVIGANPFDYAAGRRVLNQARGRPQRNLMGRKVLSEIIGLDAQHAGLSTEVGSSLLGGLLYGEPGLTVHRGVSDYEHSNMRVPAQVIGGLAHTTMLGEIGHELMRIPRTIFHLNRILEQQSQLVALGRYARRDIQEFTGSYAQTLRLQHKAVREAARGLYNTATQRDAARFIDETLGKYSRFSPRLRALIQTATPFLPWYLNAARFVFWTMPMKHPTTTAVLVSAEHAFSKDLADQHKDLPPGELKSAVKSGGGWLDIARFTPFGAFTGIVGGDLRQVASPFLPQAQGIYHALSGEDPFGRQLQVPKTPDNPKGIATQGDIRRTVLDQALGSFVPGYSPIERIAQHGETPYSGRNSLLFGIHTKPDSSHGYSGLERFANPFRPVFLKPRKQAAGVGKGNGWGAGGSSTRSSTTPSTGWGSGGGGSSSGWGG